MMYADANAYTYAHMARNSHLMPLNIRVPGSLRSFSYTLIYISHTHTLKYLNLLRIHSIINKYIVLDWRRLQRLNPCLFTRPLSSPKSSCLQIKSLLARLLIGPQVAAFALAAVSCWDCGRPPAKRTAAHDCQSH